MRTFFQFFFLVYLSAGRVYAKDINIKDIVLLNETTKLIDSPAVSLDGSKLCWVGAKRDLIINERNRVFVKDLENGIIYPVKNSFLLNADTRCHFTPDGHLLVDEILYKFMSITRTKLYKYFTGDVEPKGFNSRIVKLDYSAITEGRRATLEQVQVRELNLNHKNSYLKYAQESPDGKWMTYYISDAFKRDMGIYLYNLNTKKNLRLSSQYDKHPTWSPDGTRVLFHHQFNNGVEQAHVGYFELNLHGDEVLSFERKLLDSQLPEYVYQKHPIIEPKSGLLVFHGQKEDQGNKKLFVRKLKKDSKIFQLDLEGPKDEKLSKAKHPIADNKGGIVFLGSSKERNGHAIFQITKDSFSKAVKKINND